VAAGSVVAANTEIPPGMLAAGSPAVVKRPIDGSPAQFWVDANPSAYAELAQRHLDGLTRLD
jgi:carbonic anhydrase/acetyltransferase-like protein (isoleucine patch superfamily)